MIETGGLVRTCCTNLGLLRLLNIFSLSRLAWETA